MCRKIIFLYMLMFLSFSVEAQKVQTTKVVADKATKLPLDKVNIYNEKDNSISNEEGAFSFVSDIHELNFSLIGYENRKMSFEEVQKQDTIFLQSKITELDEVVIGTEVLLIKKAYAKMIDNYALSPYNENFFLRCTLKKNNEMSRLQDIYGKVSRNAIFKTVKVPDNKCAVEILNMRKVGIKEKMDFIDFQFQSFENLFDVNALIAINLDEFEFTREKGMIGNYVKISFIQKETNSLGQKTSGYFIINKADYAIVETYFDFYDDGANVPFKKNGKVNYRTVRFQRTTNYKKSDVTKRYYLNNANSIVRVEAVDNKEIEKRFYDYTANFFVTNSFIASKADSNLSMDKDIFRVKFPYSESFWASQNQLPLTTDLKDFLNRVSENKDKKEEFEVIGNF
ncbi:hypothetical protein RB619_18515 [Flavobacterium sp. LHD-80]|uniref:hypothetical protein n=1 Tax=Flavobacterium sp. LHD-80 TaxID=3071411 RepID=UPI0027DFD049|nr:hypothetical protein [Flavobacterium sp. LHD-80]MDQ6472637.1 hypothetical protein [Flavobacterium sp. LHD-80]